MADKIYANGIWFNKKHEKQPDFVLGSLTVSKKGFIEWLQQQTEDTKGYVRMQVLDGKEKPYVTLDTYSKSEPKQKPVEKTVQVEDYAYPEEDINPDDIPF